MEETNSTRYKYEVNSNISEDSEDYPYGGVIRGRIINGKRYDYYPSEACLEELYSFFYSRNNYISAEFSVTSTSKVSILANSEENGELCKYLDKILIDETSIDLDYFSYDEDSNKVTFNKAKQIRYPISVGTHKVEFLYKKNVDGIYNSAFEGCDRLTSIKLPNNIVFIGSNAFSGCERLNTISVPLKVVKIKEKSFYNCTSLTSVNMSPTVELENSAFEGCKLLTPFDTKSMTLGNNVFKDCLNFK